MPLTCFLRQDESSLIAGTSEGTVVQFQFMSSTVEQQDQEWLRTRTFKNHSHDVRALVHTETAVVSGGQCLIVATRRRRPTGCRSELHHTKTIYNQPIDREMDGLLYSSLLKVDKLMCQSKYIVCPQIITSNLSVFGRNFAHFGNCGVILHISTIKLKLCNFCRAAKIHRHH